MSTAARMRNHLQQLAQTARDRGARVLACQDRELHGLDPTDLPVEKSEFLDGLVQAIDCGELITSAAETPTRSDWATCPYIRLALDRVAERCRTSTRDDRSPVSLPPQDPHGSKLLEYYLSQYRSDQRSRWGVYYTPPELARYLVQRVHRTLQRQFGLRDGLAATITWEEYCATHKLPFPPEPYPASHFVQIIDPAVGTGVFLLEAIDLIHQWCLQSWKEAGVDSSQLQQRWNGYVEQHLLPRCFGLDLMLPALSLAHLNIVRKLAETGYQGEAASINLFLANTLADPVRTSTKRGFLPARDEVRLTRPVTVILGNPPFSGISSNRGEWIRGLLRGGDSAAEANYYVADGQKIDERKLWLQDDYVKFFRYGHWRLDQSGVGLIAFVSNHGFLDNTTFRGMRHQLRESFPHLEFLDLHGNFKKKEQPPGGGKDENVFHVESGVAASVLARPPVSHDKSCAFGEVWGTRDQKLATLAAEEVAWQELSPAPPYYFFVPRSELPEEYQYGWRLDQAMPLNSTVPVTARDHFVIAQTREELVNRMQVLRSRRLSDEEVRRTYFTRSRSRKYPAGDTRGWKLDSARSRIRGMRDWQAPIRTCLYRPFDQRYIYWADWMIDWPRTSVMRHLELENNFALLARRQMLPTHPCTFFWVTEQIAIDGVLRSDNRGCESLFPVFVEDEGGETKANFSSDFVASVSRRYGWRWNEVDDGDLKRSFGARDLASYTYGLFHSPEYRRRYASGLQVEFPRILLASSARLFRELASYGNTLIRLHCCHQAAAEDRTAGPAQSVEVPARSAAFWEDGQIKVGSATLATCDRSTYEFLVGGHQVCHKWLSARRGQALESPEKEHFRVIVDTIAETRKLMAGIDRSIQTAGGWPAAFLPAQPE